MTSAIVLARRLRWNRAVDGQPRPQPVVVLLGPVGSGKSFTLTSMEEDCGDAVVHARIDFSNDRQPLGEEPASTVEALAQLADKLTRKWPARGVPRFVRFTLGLIAARAALDSEHHGREAEALRALIGDFAHDPGAGQGEPTGGGDAATATVAEILPRLARELSRRPLNAVREWRAGIPGVDGDTFLDELVSLNQQADADPVSLTAWLTAAFLADVRESHPRLAKPDPRSPCVCGVANGRRHLHNWVLLLDNIDHGFGEQFLTDFQAARDRQSLDVQGDPDPLLIIASSGRWHYEWEDNWRPVWKPEPYPPDRQRTVAYCHDASYDHWIESGGQGSPPRYYPVLLESLSDRETARILGVRESDKRREFAQQATGGLPSAVVGTVAPLLAERGLKDGARDVLVPQAALDGEDGDKEDAWLERLNELRLTRRVQDINIRDFVTAAPYATAPWLMPADAQDVLPSPVGRIITELRTALWVIVPRGGRNVRLHPWVARTLISALAARPVGTENCYDAQFESFLAHVRSGHDETHEMYCRLAREQFTVVVDFFKEKFDTEPHRDWLDRLELVTSAPDNMLQSKDRATLFEELIEQRNQSQSGGPPEDRPEVGNTVARLVAAKWLAANPFAAPDPNQKSTIVNGYRDLRPLSSRADMSALSTALRAAENRL